MVSLLSMNGLFPTDYRALSSATKRGQVGPSQGRIRGISGRVGDDSRAGDRNGGTRTTAPVPAPAHTARTHQYARPAPVPRQEPAR
ncbi:hypothetical protein GCM10009818_30360 [Nakamurella flavida]